MLPQCRDNLAPMTRTKLVTTCVTTLFVALSLVACDQGSGSSFARKSTTTSSQQSPVDDGTSSNGEENELPDDADTGDAGDATGQPAPALSAVDINAARTALGSLPTRGFSPNVPKYDRNEFGKPWSDDVTVDGGHNGCDTRNDILARDLTDVEFKPAKRNCIVTKGKLNDPYTNTTIDFKRGRKSSDLIPIDHVVALGDAWYSGAYQWDADRRRNFANDPINLQATNRESNTQKSAKNAAEWLPPNTAYQCEYVGRQITIKSTYGLSVTPAEKNAMEKVLATCS